MVSLHRKWVICKGADISDSATVATVTKELWSMHGGVQVRLAGHDKAEYTLRQQGIIAGRREIDIMHHNRVIGHVSQAPTDCNHSFIRSMWLTVHACVLGEGVACC